MKLAFAFLWFALLAPAAAFAADAQDYDLLLRGGRIVDGTGNPWFYGDIAVRGGRIAAIGDLGEARAAREISVKGLIVAPGFIDVHTHADEDALIHRGMENFIRDGVTTVVSGNCGSSVKSVAAYLNDIATTGCATNVATLYGHNTVLEQVKGNKADPLTPEQLESARKILRRAMREGAVGMSTGLIYTPGKYSPTEEIIELQRAVAELGGIYATHMRSETTEILAAIDEALRIGRETGCRVEISHFKIPRDNTIGGSATTLGRVQAAREAGQEVWLDQYPYAASSTNLSVPLPDWVLEQGHDAARAALGDPATARRAAREIAEHYSKNRHFEDLSFIAITSCREHPEFAGLDMKEIGRRYKLRAAGATESAAWKTAPASALPEATLEEQCAALVSLYLEGGASCVFHTQSEEEVARILACPLVAAASDSGVRVFGEGKPHPRGYGTNARILGRYVREQKVLALEDAIRKMTSLPALAFRFRDRGVLREGAWADLTIFDPETITDLSTYEDPHHYSQGIEWVIVNGEIVLEGGRMTGRYPGQPIYGPAVEPSASADSSREN